MSLGERSVKSLFSSLRWRLLGLTIAWLIIALGVAGYIFTQLFQTYVHQQYERQLQVYMDYLVAGIQIDRSGQPVMAQPFQNPLFNQPLSGLYWQLNNEKGQSVLRSRSLWDERLTIDRDDLIQGSPHFHVQMGPDKQEVLLLEQIVRFESDPDRSWRLIVAQRSDEMEQALRQWQNLLMFFLSILFVTLALAAAVQVVLGLAPLNRLKDAIARLRSGDCPRLQGQFPAEVEPLIKDFNNVLETNEQTVERARTQAADLAHAIKTPLAVMATALDQASQDHEASPRFVGLLKDQISTMRSQVDWRLQRARASSHASLFAALVPVDEAIDALLRAMRKIHGQRNVTFESITNDGALVFRGEIQDFEEMLGNLLDNAGKWAQSKVRVSAARQAGSLVVVVEDDGPGIEPALRKKAAARWTRMDEQTPGTGLGLAIVRDLIERYQGQMELDRSSLGGLLVKLTLPGGGAQV